jgi:hypothetical protein
VRIGESDGFARAFACGSAATGVVVVGTVGEAGSGVAEVTGVVDDRSGGGRCWAIGAVETAGDHGAVDARDEDVAAGRGGGRCFVGAGGAGAGLGTRVDGFAGAGHSRAAARHVSPTCVPALRRSAPSRPAQAA